MDNCRSRIVHYGDKDYSGGLWWLMGNSARICVFDCILEVLLRQPLLLLVILWDIDTLNFENNRPCPVVATGDHHTIVISPSLHNGATLKCCIDIPADSIPCLTAEFSIHQMIKIILLWCTFQQKSIARFEKRARAGLRISQIFLLKFRKTLSFQNSNSTFVFHGDHLSQSVYLLL